MTPAAIVISTNDPGQTCGPGASVTGADRYLVPSTRFYAADFLEVAHRSDPVHHRAKDHRANHHLDEGDKAVAKRLKGFAQIRPEMADQNAELDRNQNLYVKDSIPWAVRYDHCNSRVQTKMIAASQLREKRDT